MIRRPHELSRLTTLLKNNPVVAILGARQVGKTTLAKDLQKAWKQPCHCVEVKRTSSPTITPSMKSAVSDLKLRRLFVIHAGAHSFDLAKQIRALALTDLLDELKPW